MGRWESWSCHMAWFSLTEMLLLHFFMGARCVWQTVDTILVCISLVHLQLCWLCWVQLKLQIKLSRPFKAEVLSQQSKMTWCLRCRWQVCSSSLPGRVRDCSSSPRSSYLRESQQAILHWGNDSSFKRASSDLNASDCLGTIQRTFVLRWVDPVQTVISLQRVSYSKENKESQEKPSSDACCFLGGDYLWVSWKGALESAKAACN